MLIIRVIALCVVFSLLLGCEPSSSKAQAKFEHAAQGAFTSALSSDGRYSLVSSILHGVSVWDNQQNALKYQWYQQQNEQNLVIAADIAPDNSTAVTADKTRFSVWDLNSGKNLGFYKINASSIRDIAISNQGKNVLYGRADGVVVLVNLKTGRRIEFLGHQEKINAVDLSPNGRYAFSGGNDYSAYLWDTRTGQVVHRFSHPSRVTQVALDEKGRYAFTADSKKQATIWNVNTGNTVSQLDYIAKQKIFSAVRFSPDGRFLATGSPSRKLALWDVASGKKQQSWLVATRKNSRPKSAVVYDVAFEPTGTLLSESSSGFAERFTIEKSND